MKKRCYKLVSDTETIVSDTETIVSDTKTSYEMWSGKAMKCGRVKL